MKRQNRQTLLRHTLLAMGLACSASTHADEPRLRLSDTLARVPDAKPEPVLSPLSTVGADRWQPGNSACAQLAPPRWNGLTLGEALSSALCQSPTLRQALADVAEQSAGVTLGEVARGPRWTASAGYSSSRNFNSSGSAGRTLDANVGLSWVLFDFGQRSASLKAARQTLAAAMASQSNAQLEAIRELVRLYGEAVVAAATLEASTEAEASATQTAAAAQARFQAQVGNQIDRLQAQTAQAQATLERVRAQSNWENARGLLALALGADIAQPMRLADWETWALADQDLPDINDLRREVRANHPRLRASQAQIEGLRARVDALQAEGKGSVTLNASGGNSRNWGAAGSGSIPTGNAAVVATFPLFKGRETDAQARQVLAQIDSREAEREATLREVETQLWQAHQALRTSQQSLQASERLLESASGAYRVAQGRYKAGVGSILELLSAQAALAAARRERVIAQVGQLTAQTQLSLATGRIGVLPSESQKARRP